MEARLTGIDRDETLRYLSCHGGAVPEDVSADITRCEALLRKTARPRMVWRLFSLDADGAFAGTAFRPEGNDIRAHLLGCGQAILLGATLGAEVEALLRRTQARSMGDALILDAAASAAIENVCDNLCADLAEELAPRYLTDRFSPGYGDLPLAQQREVCALLDITRRIGVTLSPGGLMLPQKTVTAIVGVSDTPRQKRRGCADCGNYGTCTYRKEGMDCGKR